MYNFCYILGPLHSFHRLDVSGGFRRSSAIVTPYTLLKDSSFSISSKRPMLPPNIELYQYIQLHYCISSLLLETSTPTFLTAIKSNWCTNPHTPSLIFLSLTSIRSSKFSPKMHYLLRWEEKHGKSLSEEDSEDLI